MSMQVTHIANTVGATSIIIISCASTLSGLFQYPGKDIGGGIVLDLNSMIMNGKLR